MKQTVFLLSTLALFFSACTKQFEQQNIQPQINPKSYTTPHSSSSKELSQKTPTKRVQYTLFKKEPFASHNYLAFKDRKFYSNLFKNKLVLYASLTNSSTQKKKRYLAQKKKRVKKKFMLPYKKRAKKQKAYKRKLYLTATAYTSHKSQTDSTPFLAAWNNKIRPGMKIVAVSEDLIKKYGLSNGAKVKIKGLKGLYTVKDKMNKRYKKRIDIYMGLNKKRALQWGKRQVILYY